jgi:hypothetical protein
LDELQADPQASEENKSHFSRLKNAAKEFREELKTTKGKLAPLAAELGIPADDIDSLVNTVRSMRSQPQLAGPDAQELEALRVFSHASKLQDSISYLKSYKQPITAAKLAWIDRAAQFWNNSPEAIKKWSDEAKLHHEEINSGWFQQQVQALVQHGKVDQLTYQGLLNEATNIVSKEDEGKRTLQEIAKNPVTFNKWSQVENEIKGQEIGAQIGKAVENAFATSHKFMEDWKSKSPDDAVFAEREKRFKATVQGAYSDPNQMARFALDHLYYKERFPEVEKELKEAKAELAALRRRIGISRKVAEVPLKTSNGHGSTIKQPTRSARLEDSKKPDWSSLGGG